MYEDKHDQRRTRILAQKLDEKGFTNETISDILNVSKRTVQRWRKEDYRDEHLRGRPIEFELDEIAPLMRNFLRDNMNATITQIQSHLKARYKIECSRMTISRLLGRDEVTHKQVTLSYSECKHEAVDEFKNRLERHRGVL
jgi:transposase